MGGGRPTIALAGCLGVWALLGRGWWAGGCVGTAIRTLARLADRLTGGGLPGLPVYTY